MRRLSLLAVFVLAVVLAVALAKVGHYGFAGGHF
jgi:hypothetical protein